jgi:hypothetical protein
MKALSILATAVLACPLVWADIVPLNVNVNATFEKSELVCKGLVTSTNVVAEQRVTDFRGRPISRKRVRATVEIQDYYKNQTNSHQTITIEFEQDAPITSAQPSIWNGETALLFLNSAEGGIYKFADRFLGATSFTRLPNVSDGPGRGKLATALVSVALAPDLNDAKNALQLLEGFDRLDGRLLARLSPRSHSRDPEIAFSTLAILIKSSVPGSVEQLQRYLDGYAGSDSIPIQKVGVELGKIRDGGQLNAIEALTRAKFVSIRYGAMDAIRGIRAPQSTQTLIDRLDDSDNMVRYVALITLAEIYGKYGEYAPSMQLFNKNPNYYVGLWKKWRSENK